VKPFRETARETIRNPMKYTLGQAAKAVGKSKATIHRDIKSGKLSADRQDDGSYRIDAAELFRVYPPANTGSVSETPGETARETIRNPQETGETKALEAELRLLRERLAEKDELVADLRQERDRLLRVVEEQAGSMRLLTDQREAAPPARGLFGWFRRRR
jgi:hypothetical protein